MIRDNPIVTVIGGAGFLGSYVVRRLAKLGFRIQVLSRNASLKAQKLNIAGAVGQIALIDSDATNYKKLEKCIEKSDYVVNLIGTLYSRGRQNFEALHHVLPQKVAELCTKHKVKKFVHVSALLSEDAGDSQYAKSKLAGEKAILKHYPNASILRPSVLFGAEDNFINMFNNMSKISLFMPLIGGGNTKFQPVYVDDVAASISACLQDKEGITNGKIFELGGPKVYSMRAIMELILKITGRKRLFLSIPFPIAKTIACFTGALPKPLLTLDQVNLLKHDNILTKQDGLKELGIKPRHLEIIVPTYLS
ncbi:MAG: hypothetical protein K0R73_242 [Candidatus Midichloriaceae bacterium]|jgi:NADH dehydrogenase|nr:hypothetical protein [Candidatus Midichloriaceae bacterium]